MSANPAVPLSDLTWRNRLNLERHGCFYEKQNLPLDNPVIIGYNGGVKGSTDLVLPGTAFPLNGLYQRSTNRHVLLRPGG